MRAAPRPDTIRAAVRGRVRAAPTVLLYAQVAHVVGDASVAAALASTMFFEVPVGEARTEVGFYLLLAFAPYAVLAPLVAPVIARRARAHGGVLVVTHTFRALAAVLLVGRLDTALLYPLGFALLVLSRTHAIAKGALVPALTREEDLLDANAAISFVSGVAGVVGGGTALALSAVAGAPTALLLAGAAFAAGTLTGLWLRPPAKGAGDLDDTGWLTSLESVRMTAAVLAVRTCLGFTAMLVAFRFHGSDERLALIASGVALGLGTWSASLLVPPLRRSLTRLQIASGPLAVLAVVALIAWITGGAAAGIALAATVGLAGGTSRLAFDAHVQDCWPPEARGPGYARYETVLQLGWVIGAAPAALLGLSVASGAVAIGVVALGGIAAVLAAESFLS